MLAPEDRQFLSDITRATVHASRVAQGQAVAGSVPNSTGQTLIRPGGRDCYPAFWPRDFAMSLDSGFITRDEALHALRVIAKSQNGAQPRNLPSSAAIPPFAIPDHVLFDGSPVFYPGAMSAGDDQGGEPFGILPPADDHYEFIHIAHWLYKTTGDWTFTRQKIADLNLLERMTRAFDVPTSDPSTGGMFFTSLQRRAVGMGFYDIVHLSGSVLFPSLLRHRAALQLAEFFSAMDRAAENDHYSRIAQSIESHIVPIFADPHEKHAWLLAATETGRQPDVWGTLYALHRNLLPADFAKRARITIADAVTRGSIVSHAAVRHVPLDHDFSKDSAWQKTAPGVPRGTYQNGAYWHTPTGWLIEALKDSHPIIANQLCSDYLAHLRNGDFQKGPAFGAPFECFSNDLAATRNPVYMTSVTVPWSILNT